jgi:hypothetical protein
MRPVRARISLPGKRIRCAWQCNLLGVDEASIETNGGSVEVNMEAWSLQTVRLETEDDAC